MFSADQIWNNLLKEIARKAFEAGDMRGYDQGAYDFGAIPLDGEPDFEEWWETFVEQNHTDG